MLVVAVTVICLVIVAVVTAIAPSGPHDDEVRYAESHRHHQDFVPATLVEKQK